MLNIGPGELLLVLVVALLVLGPNKLPDAARQVGKAIGEMRKLSSGFQAEMRDAMKEPVEGKPGRSASSKATPAKSGGSLAAPRLPAGDAATTPGPAGNGQKAPAPSGDDVPQAAPAPAGGDGPEDADAGSDGTAAT